MGKERPIYEEGDDYNKYCEELEEWSIQAEKDKDELLEAVEMARDEAIDRREGRKIDYPNALEGYLTELLERYK